MTAMEFPLIEHELRRLGRRWSTYAMRFVPIGIVFIAMLFNMMMVATMRSIGARGMAPFDYEYNFEIASGVQFGIVMLFAPVLAAMAIAREKQDRTLGLLVLAEYRSFDIYISKAACVLLAVGSLVMGIVPMSILGVVLGGVTLGEFCFGAVRLIIAMVLVTSLGLLCSALSNRAVDAVIMTYAILFAGVFLLPDLLYPASELLGGSSVVIMVATTAVSVILPLAFSAGFAVWTVRLLEKMVEESSVCRWGARQRRKSRRDKAGIAAVYAGAAQSLGSVWMSPPRRWVTMAIGALIGYTLQSYIGFTLHWPVLFILAYDMITTVEGSARQGTLDVLGCAPTTDRAFARAIIMVHFKRGLTFFPALAIGTMLGLFSPSSMFNLSLATLQDAAIAALVVVVSILGDLLSLILIAAIGSYVVTGPGGTPRRLTYVVLHYVLVNMLGSFLSIVLVSVPFTLAQLNRPNAVTFMSPGMAAGMAAVGVVVTSLCAFSYYNRLSKRIGNQWRNGGTTKVIVNPVPA